MAGLRLQKVVMTLVAVVIGTVVLPGCLIVEATEIQTVTAPDPDVTTEFGSAFSMDEDRIVVRAKVDGHWVVHVYDTVGAGWALHSTIPAPEQASPRWGESIAVSGDEVAVADPRGLVGFSEVNRGAVALYRWAGGEWTQEQTFVSDAVWANYAAGVWLSGDGLLIWSDVVCDYDCTEGSWDYFQRNGSTFERRHQRSPGTELSVGVDGGRVAIGSPGYFMIDNTLTVIHDDRPATPFVDERWSPVEGPEVSDFFEQVDLSGDVLAFVNCCTSERQLHLRRFDGTTYQPEVSFPLLTAPRHLLALDGLVLLADPDAPTFHSYARVSGRWKMSNEVALPAGASFSEPPVAVGNRVIVGGDEAVHVVTVEVVDDAVEAT